ncbi:histidine kinase [Stylonychia lemnae]|uniref:Histidine kinase n=1 Tax=Stylonychia lemnae TaxID=5949 RepID=A0A078ACF3_STYLE|nr:histidine kinase [Stylonychia lemnae]|eukprot:CDW78508.1 histidine kinase [Stylonychia lemnae]
MQATNSSVQFGQLYEQKRIQERNIQIAKSILDSIDQLETEPDAVKRWGWELIQNAQDAYDASKPVKIRIILEEDKLRFLHNGRPFSLKDIMNLVEKGSDKDRPQYYSETPQPDDDFDSFVNANNSINSTSLQQSDNQAQNLNLDEMVIPETTGRFGTGFLTTYLLSKKVSVDGVFQHTDTDQCLYKKFQLVLNRDTKDVQKMLSNNQKSSEIFKNLDNHEKWPFLEDYESGLDFDTCFTYYLSEHGVRNAQEGLKNLIASTPYVIAFSKKIETIEIFDRIEQQKQQYTFRIDRNPVITLGDIQILKYFINDEEKQMILAFNKYSQLACFVQQKEDGMYEIVEKDSCIPNFFVDYPLIGSQSLKFSVVFNSHLFYPNEKRSGICLDESLGFKAQLNTLVMQKLSQLFQNFLDFVINYGFSSVHHLKLSSNHLVGNQNMFLKNLLITPIISKFVESAIIECKDGLAPLKAIMIPDIEVNELKSFNQQQVLDLWNILDMINDNQRELIKRDFLYIQNWIQVFDDQDWKPHLNNTQKCVLTHILAALDDVKMFLEKIYLYIENYKDLNFKAKIKELKLYIDQNNQLKKLDDLKVDDGIDEYYKKICLEYGYDLRATLFHNNYIPYVFKIIPKMNVEALDDQLLQDKFIYQVVGLQRSQVIKPGQLALSQNTLFQQQSQIQQNKDKQRQELQDLLKKTNISIPSSNNLGLQISALDFLNQFYPLINNYQKLYTSRTTITKSVMFNKKEENLRSSKNSRIILFQIYDDSNMANELHMTQLFNMYLEIKQITKDDFFKRTLHTSLPQALLVKHLANHEIFSSIKMCLEFDQIIVEKCSSIDFIKKSESFLNRFDKLHLTTFKDDKIEGVSATEYYFPKYQKERKNILVKLRQNGEMTNLLFEIYQNEQEQQMRLLTKAMKSNYQVLEGILKYAGEKDQISEKIVDVIKSEGFQSLNDEGFKELIDSIQQIAFRTQQQPQAQTLERIYDL